MFMRTLRYVVLVLMLQAASRGLPGNGTTARQLHDTMIVRRGNIVIAATTDGFVCYGTRMPRVANCHRAVTLKGII